ncbi:hypothetical protein vseg_005300 [Gypsophila vaccaria]
MRLLRLISHTPKFTRPNYNPQFLGFSPNSIPNKNYSIAAEQQSTPSSSPPLTPPSDKINSIADDIANLTLIEVADLTTLLSNKLEVKDMPMVSLMMPGMGFSLRGIGGSGGGGGAAGTGEKKVEETVAKTCFDLKLEAGFEPGAKIKIIKELRTFTDLGLKEAKELVEKAPVVLKTAVSKDEAEKIVEKMKAIGAKVVLE